MIHSSISMNLLLILGLSASFNAAALQSGAYILKNNHSGKVMSVAGGSFADGANILQQEENGSRSQLWNVTNLGAVNIRLFPH